MASTKGRENCWDRWAAYVGPMGVDPYLQETPFTIRVRLLSGFAGRVRTGYYGRGKQVQACSVSSAITAVGQAIALATNTNPTKIVGSDKLLPRLQQMLDGFRKARDLVSYVNSSVLAKEKIRAKQAQDPDCTVFKLLSDVETRWWSTHTLVERVLKLKDTLVDVFANEFCFRDSPNQLTALEKLQLTDDDFLALSDVLTLLTPFRDSQKALEGELYVSISLLPLVVHHLSHELMVLQGSVDPDYQGTLFELITKMKDDFESRWGTRVQYFSTTQRSSRRRQSGLPTYSFWAMALDPRTKKMIPKILSANDVQLLWKDILDAVLEVAQSSSSYIDPVPPVAAAEGQAPRNNKKRVAQFLVDYLDTEEETIDVVQEQLSLEVRVSREVELFKLCHGCSLTCTEGSYVDPLQWWKENYKIYPNVWLVAIRILCIPATSAPAERVFSAASNLVNKKRIRLHPDSVDLLIYLCAKAAPGF